MSDEVKVANATVETKTRKNHAWDEKSKDFVRNNATKLTDVEGAKQLGVVLGKEVSVSSYRKIRQDLKIKKLPGRGVSRVASGTAVIATVSGSCELVVGSDGLVRMKGEEEQRLKEAATPTTLPF